MSTKTRTIRWVAGILVLCLMSLSCGLLTTIKVGDTQTDIQSVELGSAQEVKIEIQMGAGELAIAGNAGSLMEGNFRFNVADWKPQITYTESGSRGELRVNHPDLSPTIPVGKTVVNQWNLLFNNSVPIDLVVDTGAGTSVLDLRALDLNSLSMETGAGVVEVDLRGNYGHDLRVMINGGVGELTVRLPDEMGVRVSTEMGIGGLTNSGLMQDGEAYVNALYGNSPHTLFLEIETGIGAIHLLAP